MRGEAEESFIELKNRDDKSSKTIVRIIERIISILKENPQFGDPIKKELIPSDLVKQGVKIYIEQNFQIIGDYCIR